MPLPTPIGTSATADPTTRKLDADQLPAEMDIRLSVLAGIPAELLAASLGDSELAVDSEAQALVVGDGYGGFFAPAPTADELMARMGAQLTAALREVWPANPGTMLVATSKLTASVITVKTSTGYGRVILADGTLGAQGGAGVAGVAFVLTLPAGVGLRPLGVVSVSSGGAVRSGHIASIVAIGAGLRSIEWEGPDASTTGVYLDLSGNLLTSLDAWDLSACTSVVVNVNRNALRTLPLWDVSSATEFQFYAVDVITLQRLPLWDLSGCEVVSIEVYDDVSGSMRLRALPPWDFSASTALTLNVSGCPLSALPAIDLGGPKDSCGVFLTGCGLSAELVDYIFSAWTIDDTDGGSSGVYLQGNAPPTAASAAKRAAMESGGWDLIFV
jgi:hypothetical protein